MSTQSNPKPNMWGGLVCKCVIDPFIANPKMP